MLKFKFYIIIPLLFCFSKILIAQKITNNIASEYVNAQLYNGELYNLVKQNNIKGHQFFADEEFVEGEVKIKGVVYNNLELNYDIFNQKLVLRYITPNGSVMVIAVSKAWLEEFTLKNNRFILDNESKVIYQIIGTCTVRIFYQWKKSLAFRSNLGESFYYYSAPQRESFIEKNGNKIRYTDNRSFLSLFKKEDRIAIKKFMKNKKINVKKASDESMLLVIHFCGNSEK